jgi:hypothetical protein
MHHAPCRTTLVLARSSLAEILPTLHLQFQPNDFSQGITNSPTTEIADTITTSSRMPGSQYPTGSFPGSLPPPLGVTPDINFVPSRLNLITQVACIAVTTIFLFLRFYTKHIVGLGFFAEDCEFLST